MRLRSLAIILLLLAIPLAAGAQATRKPPRVGIVQNFSSQGQGRQHVDVFRRQLQELGYVDGKTVAIEERWADGKLDRVGDLIADLVRSDVDVIVVQSLSGARAAKRTVTTTPVVFVSVTDPVGTGLVNSLARPGGNLTGPSLFIGEDLAAKWVELVKEAAPRTSSLAALSDPGHPMARRYAGAVDEAARGLGLKLQAFDVRDVAGLDGALAMIAKAAPGALIVPASPFFGVNRKTIAAFALKRGIPTITYDRHLVVDGLLMSYGPEMADAYRRGAVYVDKLLKGAKPADLPVEQPTKFELVLNLKTAKALGLTIPRSLRLRADHVIE